MDRHAVYDVLLSYDLSILVLQWLRLPDLIAFGGLCRCAFLLFDLLITSSNGDVHLVSLLIL